MICRSCGQPLSKVFIDLGSAPPSNAYLTAQDLELPEVHYPLKLFFCEECHLVQIDEYKDHGDIFCQDYAYFSSYSSSWVEHARRYVAMIVERLGLTAENLVLEIASNDGYLLEHVKERGIPCLGVEPSLKTARACMDKGIEVVTEFFDSALARRLAAEGRRADLIVANNVLAHVPNVNDFAAGLATCLKERGVATLEFPHLMRLVSGNQFDTIYHEHFSYFSLGSASRILERGGLEVFDVEELPTHGGSLRLYARLAGAGKTPSGSVERILRAEKDAGMNGPAYYQGFQEKADQVKYDLLAFLLQAREKGKLVAGYGAAAKGNTLLNYCGLRPDLLPFVADASPHKQGKYLPGSHIPVTAPEEIFRQKPDFVLILPWNIRREIQSQLAGIREWGGKFVTAIPSLKLF